MAPKMKSPALSFACRASGVSVSIRPRGVMTRSTVTCSSLHRLLNALLESSPLTDRRVALCLLGAEPHERVA